MTIGGGKRRGAGLNIQGPVEVHTDRRLGQGLPRQRGQPLGADDALGIHFDANNGQDRGDGDAPRPPFGKGQGPMGPGVSEPKGRSIEPRGGHPDQGLPRRIQQPPIKARLQDEASLGPLPEVVEHQGVSALEGQADQDRQHKEEQPESEQGAHY